MMKRGAKLAEHILWSAKEVFSEIGFERASMDEVAHRARTSKRSLYAHFESKEKLFLAVVDLIRSRFLAGLGSPGDYAAEPVEAITLFCAHYLEFALYVGGIQMCRMTLAEAERFPLGAAQWFDVIFTQVHGRLAEYLQSAFSIGGREGGELADALLARVLFPRFFRALFGVDHPLANIDPSSRSPNIDTRPVRRVVVDVLGGLQRTNEKGPRPAGRRRLKAVK
jgi:AcrR family transcriptional regulator